MCRMIPTDRYFTWTVTAETEWEDMTAICHSREGFFDGRDNVTISMDVNEVSRTGNYFTFAIGPDRDKYLFLKIDPTNLKLAITTGSYSTEQVASKSGAYPNNSRTWMNIMIVLTPDKMSLYRDGELVAEENVTVACLIWQESESISRQIIL